MTLRFKIYFYGFFRIWREEVRIWGAGLSKKRAAPPQKGENLI
jgi:hypothetical protein